MRSSLQSKRFLISHIEITLLSEKSYINIHINAKADLNKLIDQLKLSVGIIPESLYWKEYYQSTSQRRVYLSCITVKKLRMCTCMEEDYTLSQLTSGPVRTESATNENIFPVL